MIRLFIIRPNEATYTTFAERVPALGETVSVDGQPWGIVDSVDTNFLRTGTDWEMHEEAVRVKLRDADPPITDWQIKQRMHLAVAEAQTIPYHHTEPDGFTRIIMEMMDKRGLKVVAKEDA